MYETKLAVAAEEWENYETIMRAEISRKFSNEKNDRPFGFFFFFFLFNLRVMLFPYKIGHKIKIE